MTKEIKHGLPSSYTSYGCRCDICKTNWAEYHRKYSLLYRERNLELERKRRREYWHREKERDPVGTRERQRLAKAKYETKKRNML